MPTRQDRESGSSLIEVLMGSVLAITVLGAVTVNCIHQSNLQKLDRQVFLAHNACESTMESIRGMAITELPMLDGRGFDVPTIDGAPGGLSTRPSDPDGLPGEIHVTVDEVRGDDILYRVRLFVTWGSGGAANDYELVTLMTRRAGG